MKTFAARFIRPALYLPINFFPFFPGSPLEGLKFRIIRVIARIDRPIMNFINPKVYL